MWLAVHLATAVAGIVAVALGVGGLWLAPLLALVIGHGFAGMAFVAHETLHGSVVQGRRLRHAIGWFGFLPFALSPTLWVGWHNRVHHGHTMEDGVDPDAYPTLERYARSLRTRVGDHMTPGRGRWAGVMTLAVGFTVQSLTILVQGRRAARLSRRQHLRSIAETALGVAVWAVVGAAIGPAPFLFAFVIPLLVGNALVITYILTNHSLSPLTAVNDPLVNSLSVTTPRLVSALHLQFGYHVEHPLFPAMSPRHASRVRDELVRLWPERYQSMPLWRAFGRLWSTARVYATPRVLHDPRSGRAWPALLPPAEAAAAAEEARRAGAPAERRRRERRALRATLAA